MRYTAVALVLPFLTLTLASSVCDSSSAQPFSSSSSSSSDDVCVQTCGSDEKCLQACYSEEQTGQCNSVGCRRKRSSFVCDPSQTCYQAANGVLMCLDTSTGDYTDQYGGVGNANDGSYSGPVNPDGTLKSGYSLATGGVTSATGSVVGAAASATAYGTGTSADKSTPTAGSVVVSTGAANKLNAGIVAAVGVAGPLLGWVL